MRGVRELTNRSNMDPSATLIRATQTKPSRPGRTSSTRPIRLVTGDGLTNKDDSADTQISESNLPFWTLLYAMKVLG